MTIMQKYEFNRRPLVLFVVGFAWLSMGISVLLDPVELSSSPYIPFIFLPMPVRVIGWSVTGIVAIGFALCRKQFWVCKHTWIGWLALGLMPLQRMVSYAIGVGYELTSRGYTSVYDSVFRDFVGWFVVLFFIAITVGWPDKREEHTLEQVAAYGSEEGER